MAQTVGKMENGKRRKWEAVRGREMLATACSLQRLGDHVGVTPLAWSGSAFLHREKMELDLIL